MGALVKVLILGPMQITVGKHSVELPRPRQRALLAILALSANRTVHTDNIVDMMWGSLPPRQVRNQIQVHISHIRKALRRVGADSHLKTQPNGYQLQLHPGGCDVAMFSALDSIGAQAVNENRHEAAAQAYRLALKSWRGAALSGLEGAFVQAQAQLLQERRRSVFCRWVDLEIGFDRPQHLAPALMEANQRDPYDEGIALRLMAVLQRCGRTADALNVYQSLRRTLGSDLGLNPTETLRTAENALLHSTPIHHDAWRFRDLRKVTA
jgi:DNA-binding SARP family transcriptional activator